MAPCVGATAPRVGATAEGGKVRVATSSQTPGVAEHAPLRGHVVPPARPSAPPLPQRDDLAGAPPTLLGGSCGFVLRFSGISQQRVDRFRMAVAAMCAASASCV